MRNIIAMVLIGVLGVAGVVNAQEAVSEASKSMTPIPGGSKSLGFEVTGGDDSLVFIKGAYFIKEDLAIRLGFGFLDSDDEEMIAVSIGIRNYFKGFNAVRPFIGAAVQFSSGSKTVSASDSSESYYYDYYNSESDSTSQDTDSFQLEGNFGFEFFFRENISLGASVGLRFTSTDSGDDDEERISTFSSGAGYGVGAAVNVYF